MSSGNMDHTRWNSADRNGSPPPPRYDSNGKKVPIWEAVEVDIRDDEKKTFLQSQPSWKSLVSRASSWGSIRSNPTERKRNWKPVTLRFPILGSIFAVTVSMIIGLEILSYVSIGKNNANGGGLAFAATVDDLSVAATFSYLYLPTVIAVIYSMVWNWVDLDSKRLEPWFQLSKPEGATAENSILLQYPFDFLAFVPMRAARRRHWAVVISGSTMIFITWAIVPLQSAIFSTGVVTRTRGVPMITTAELLPIAAQTETLNTQFLNTAYGISWLDQKLPPYTTKEYALRPFAPAEKDLDTLSSETWSATTVLYHTNLTCEAAKMTKAPQTDTYIFDSGDGCAVQLTLPGAAQNRSEYMVLYVQYYDDAHVAWALQNPNCSKEHSHKSLALWGSNTPYTDAYGVAYREYRNVTALFCETKYYLRTATATVNASDHAVVGISFDSTVPPDIMPEDIFNITNYEYIMGTGITERTTSGDLPNINIVGQYPRLVDADIQWPVSNMVGYGLAASTGGPKDLFDPVELHKAFDIAHKLLFSTAVNTLLSSTGEDSTANSNIGTRQDYPGSIVLVRTFAVIVEVCLGVVGILTCVLWIYYQQRRSNMTSDPASVSDVMKLVRTSQSLLHDFNDNGTVTTTILEERLQGHRFRLTTSDECGLPMIRLEALGNENADGFKGMRAEKSTSIDCPEQFQAVRPLELKYMTGILIATVIVAVISALSVLYARIIRFDGLKRPSENPLVLSILLNLIPTAFATLIEPFWVILNRLLCILQPFEDLRTGNAESRATVEAKYTSLPPQLVIWRAIRSRHFLLALVCIVAVSTNALAVALSGIFNESIIQVTIPIDTTRTITPAFNGTPSMDQGAVEKRSGFIITYLDHYYVALANLNGGAPLPPWADNSYFYLPFMLPNSSSADNSQAFSDVIGFEATTRGFGLDVQCKEISAEGDDDTVLFRAPKLGTEAEFSVSHKLEGGGNITCVKRGSSTSGFRPTIGEWTNDTSALEIMEAMSLPDQADLTILSNNYCNSLLLAGWVRLGAADLEAAPVSNDTEGRSMESVFMTCSPTFTTALFDIRVDGTGRIISSNRSSDFDTDLSPYGTEREITSLVQQASELTTPRSPIAFRWHTDSFTSDWMNSLLRAKLNSSDTVNPASPLPNITTLVPHVEDLYQGLFSIILALNSTLFANSPAPIEMPAFVVAAETRIFMDPVMFYITVTLLALQFFVAIAYYAKRPKRFLPRMPLTIASIISYVSASHALKDCDGADIPPKEIRYGYGRFKGVDGHTHVGIEKEPLVVPLKSKNPDVKRRKLAWIRKKPDPSEPKTWI